MKTKLYVKFLLAYALLAIVGTIFISTVGSHLIQQQILDDTGEALYKEAMSIAADQGSADLEDSDALEDYYNTLYALAVYEDARIVIWNPSGEPLLDTGVAYQTAITGAPSKFDPASMSTGYYQTGSFYGYFEENMVNSLVPITGNLTTRGYISIHVPMTVIIEKREAILKQVYIIFIVMLLLSLLILVLFTFSVYRPLKEIITGANEYAAGNLDYEIPVHTEDEIGYLADTLNYMSDELSKQGEYQHRFVANVSHDFRSPLTSIKGFLEAILDGTIPPELQDKYLRLVVDETERLEKLTRSLLTLDKLDSKGRPIHKTDFDINKTIKNTAASFEAVCRKKRISFELHLESESLFVNADLEQIQQVLYNLIDNAVKFSSNDSMIRLETTERHGTVFVSVKDTGTGIPKESLNKIWDRFYKIDSSRGKDRKGTGLGLSIVKEIINAHGQNINVISTEGVGTEFIFTLDASRNR